MSLRLPPRCYQGLVPALITTCDAKGEPNITYVSQVYYIDEGHVALSCQFFNKTKQNLLENPLADVQLYDPVSFDAYRLTLRFTHSETSGPLFDAMATRIQAIASHTGMAGIFRLLSADVFGVLEASCIEGFLLPEGGEPTPPDPLSGPRSELRGLQQVSQALCSAYELEELVSVSLESLDDAFGFEHAMLLLCEEGETGVPALRLAGSHGYPSHVSKGGRVQLGEGLIGTVAKERKPLRFSGLPAELRYGRAIRSSTELSSERGALSAELPLPGLPDSNSHLALPLLVAQRLIGVLAVESRKPMAFDEWDEAFLEIVANQLALALEGALARRAGEQRAEAPPRTDAKPDVAPVAPGQEAPPASEQEGRERREVLRVQFFRNDDCVFVNGQYLIRNLPGRILWKILRAHADSGRSSFTNRELRLDPWLGLPAIKDNLESRLALLRKRLEQRCPELSLEPRGRGQFELVLSAELELSEAESGAEPS